MSSDPGSSSASSGVRGARVLLVGMGPTTESALAGLVDRFDVVGLLRSAPAEDAALRLAAARDVPVHTDPTVAALRKLVADADPDCVVVSSYDRILPADLVTGCPFVNVHYAPLPRYRGRATVNWAIINGETETAVTVHSLVAGLDAGGILRQEPVPIGPHDTVTDVYRRLNDRQRQILADAVARRLAGDEGEPQDESLASYACARVPADGEVDWAAPTEVTYRLVRALAEPFPAAFTRLGGRRLEIVRARPVEDPPVYVGRVPGRVARVVREDSGDSENGGSVDVLTGDGILRIFAVREGEDGAVPASRVIRSTKTTLGGPVT